MKKELLYDSEAYYYEYIDGEDGTPLYGEPNLTWYDENCLPYKKLDNWEYDEYMAEEDYHNMLDTLDEMNRGRQVKIEANLGLWDGRHKCEPVEEDDFEAAIGRCINGSDSFEVYQAGKWTLYIDAHHHDGTNHFKLTCYL